MNYLKTGSFVADTAKTSGQTQAITGLGFQPNFVIFWGSGQTSASPTNALSTADANPFFGAASGSGTANKGISGITLNNVGTSDTAGRQAGSRAINTITNTSTANGVFEVTSLDSDGFTLTVRDAFETATVVHYLAGKTDGNVKVGSWATGTGTGNASVTDPGFQPDVVIFFSNFNTVDSLTANMELCVGAIDSAGNQWVSAINSRDAQNTSVTASYFYTGECIARVNAAATSKRAAYVSMDATGFTLNWLENTAAHTINYIAISGMGGKVGTIQTETSTSTNISVSGLSSTPLGGILAGVNKATSTQDTATSELSWSLGGYHAYYAGETLVSGQACGVIADEHNQGTTITAKGVRYDACYGAIDTAQAWSAVMGVSDADSASHTFLMSTADSSQKRVGYVILGLKPSLTASLTGAMSSSGTLAKSVGKSVSGAITSAGSIIKKTFLNTLGCAGSWPDGGIGTLYVFGQMGGDGGILTATKKILVSLSGAMTSAGTLIRRAGKSFVGAAGSSGSLIKRTAKSFTGAVTSSGTLSAIRTFLRTITGAMSSSGALVRKTFKNNSPPYQLGNLASSGSLTKSVRKSFAGAVTSAGTIRKRVAKSFAGATTSAGTLIRKIFKNASPPYQLGNVAMSGSVTKRISKISSGAMALSGLLSIAAAKITAIFDYYRRKRGL